MQSKQEQSLDQLDSLPIAPLYRQSTPNELISLGEFKATLSTDSENESVEGQASFRFLPEKNVELVVPNPEDRSDGVHPNRTTVVSEGAYYQAWKLSLWLIDLVFLRIFGFDGNYGNRLMPRAIGDIKPVPWNQKTVH